MKRDSLGLAGGATQLTLPMRTPLKVPMDETFQGGARGSEGADLEVLHDGKDGSTSKRQHLSAAGLLHKSHLLVHHAKKLDRSGSPEPPVLRLLGRRCQVGLQLPQPLLSTSNESFQTNIPFISPLSPGLAPFQNFLVEFYLRREGVGAADEGFVGAEACIASCRGDGASPRDASPLDREHI